MTREIGPEFSISVVAPIYNEAAVIESFVEEISGVLESLALPGRRELVLVNDGSYDRSGEALDDMARRYPGFVKVVHLARNFGQAAAVAAGLDQASGDVIILMDADMQDDPAVFRAFLDKWQAGADVVYAQRSSRAESRAFRFFVWLFYRLLGWMANIEMPLDAGNFALMDRRVVEHVRRLPERNRYFPGLRAWVGFRQEGVAVPRRARYDRSTRVGIRGLWTLGMNAVFSFSYVPLFVFRFLGVASIALSVILLVYALYHKLVSGKTITDWASQLMTVSFFGGVNLTGIAVVGEYVARIYDEVKGRPIYVIDRVTEGGTHAASEGGSRAASEGGEFVSPPKKS